VIAAVGRIQALEADLAFARQALEQLLCRKERRCRTVKASTALIEALRRNPRALCSELASLLYQQDTPTTRHRVRAILHNLKERGRIAGSARNGWELPNGGDTAS